jgi:glycosyltransferase involved in cell wall biosynthesis
MSQSQAGIDGANALVTVVLPTRLRDGLLVEALASALTQTYVAIEIIVSDSGSSETTRELVASFNDDRIRYRRTPNSSDSLANHVAAIAEARGEYVAVLHDDDIWETRFIERLVAPLESRRDCVLAFCDQTIIDVHGIASRRNSDMMSRRYGRYGLDGGVHLPFRQLVVSQSIPMLTGTVFRRSALSLPDMDRQAGSACDLWMSYLLCRGGQGAYYVPERLVRYRVHPGAESAQPSNRQEGNIWVWQQLSADPAMAKWRRQMRRKLARAHQMTALLSLWQYGWRTSFGHALAGFRLKPDILGAIVIALFAVPTSVLPVTARIRFAYRYTQFSLQWSFVQTRIPRNPAAWVEGPGTGAARSHDGSL